MFFIEYIFIWSEKIVDLLIGSLLKLVTWILQLIGQGFYLLDRADKPYFSHTWCATIFSFCFSHWFRYNRCLPVTVVSSGIVYFFTTYVNRFKIYVRMGRFIRNCLLCVSDDKKTHSFYHLFF